MEFGIPPNNNKSGVLDYLDSLLRRHQAIPRTMVHRIINIPLHRRQRLLRSHPLREPPPFRFSGGETALRAVAASTRIIITPTAVISIQTRRHLPSSEARPSERLILCIFAQRCHRLLLLLLNNNNKEVTRRALRCSRTHHQPNNSSSNSWQLLRRPRITLEAACPLRHHRWLVRERISTPAAALLLVAAEAVIPTSATPVLSTLQRHRQRQERFLLPLPSQMKTRGH